MADDNMAVPCPPGDVYCEFGFDVWREQLEKWRKSCCERFPDLCVPNPSIITMYEDPVVVIPADEKAGAPYMFDKETGKIPPATLKALNDAIDAAKAMCPDCDVPVVMVQEIYQFGNTNGDGTGVKSNQVGIGISADAAQKYGLHGAVVILTKGAASPLEGVFPNVLPHEAAHAGYSTLLLEHYGPLHPPNPQTSGSGLPAHPTTPPPPVTPNERDCAGLAGTASIM